MRPSSLRITGAIPIFLLLAFILCTLSEAKDRPKPARPAKDALASEFKAVTLPAGSLPKAEIDAVSFEKNELLNSLSWDKSKLHELASSATAACSGTDLAQAYVIHVAQWKATGDSTFSLVSSDWFVYHSKKDGTLVQAKLNAQGQPLLYGLQRVLLIGINFFDKDQIDEKKLEISYN